MTAPPRIAAVVLAAGRSSRLPGNKLLQRLDGKTIVRRAVEVAVASQAKPVIVVTGNEAERVQGELAGLPITIVDNADYAAGLSSSLKCGLRSIPPACDGALIGLGDMPFVTADVYDKLINAFALGHSICVPVHRGRRGNPVLWARPHFAEMLALSGDKGAKQLMVLHSNLVFELEVPDDGILIDIDTPDDLKHHTS